MKHYATAFNQVIWICNTLNECSLNLYLFHFLNLVYLVVIMFSLSCRYHVWFILSLCCFKGWYFYVFHLLVNTLPSPEPVPKAAPSLLKTQTFVRWSCSDASQHLSFITSNPLCWNRVFISASVCEMHSPGILPIYSGLREIGSDRMRYPSSLSTPLTPLR